MIITNGFPHICNLTTYTVDNSTAHCIAKSLSASFSRSSILKSKNSAVQRELTARHNLQKSAPAVGIIKLFQDFTEIIIFCVLALHSIINVDKSNDYKI